LSVFGGLSLVLVFWLPRHMGDHLAGEVARRGRLAAEVLDKSAIGALAMSDESALNQLTKGLIRDSDILYAVILDKDGRVLADNGIDKSLLAGLEPRFREALKRDSDWTSSSERWIPSQEPVIHVCRPVYYEQLRIGTVLLGISLRRVALTVSQFRGQLAVLCGLLLIIALLATYQAARSFSKSLSKISEAIGAPSQEGLETLGRADPCFAGLIEEIRKARTAYSDALRELEAQRLLLETDLAQMQEENALLNSRLNTVQKQVALQQDRIMTAEAQSRHSDKLAALIQFATSIVTEVETSMHHIGQGAEQLRRSFHHLTGLFDRLESSSRHTAEETEQIRKYKAAMGYDQLKESMDELVATIQGGASWAGQLVDMLRQLATSSTSKGK
jgi:methyl-accepting chemotaxis protein